nr:hypothetical protein BaRGS_007396 [Batillaria attramentaria]
MSPAKAAGEGLVSVAGPEEQFNNELNAVLEPPRRVYLETDELGLCILHKLLSVIKYMHDNKFSHQDITDRNILVRMSNMQLAVIDLESAVKLWPDAASGMADPKGKSEGLIDVDFNDAYMIFCALYTAGNNTDIHQLESELRKGRSKRLADGYELQWCSSQVMGGTYGELGSWDNLYYA